MFFTPLLIGLVGALSQWESRMMGEIKLSQPLVTGLLVGIVLGDVKTGVMMGAQFQLLWMGISGVGATPMMDVGVGSILGTSFAILSGAGIELALTLALPVALLSQYINVGIRTLINGFMPKADAYAAEGNMAGMARIHWFGASLFFLLGFVPCFCGIMFGSEAVQTFVNIVPAWITNGLSAASKLLPALGFALLMHVTMGKGMLPYFILGFAVSAYLNVPVTGIAIIGFAIAMMVFQFNGNRASADMEEEIL